MKTLIAIVVLFATHFSARAEECKLQTPLPIPATMPAEGITFEFATANETPKFQSPSAFVPGKSHLDINIFPVSTDTRSTSFWGANFGLHEDPNTTVGNANIYMGVDHELSGGTEEIDGVQVHTFKYHMFFEPIGGADDPFFGCPYNGSGDAYEQTVIKVKDGFITSIEISFPVLLEWTNPRGETLLSYTGEHQKLCVQNAKAD